MLRAIGLLRHLMEPRRLDELMVTLQAAGKSWLVRNLFQKKFAAFEGRVFGAIVREGGVVHSSLLNARQEKMPKPTQVPRVQNVL